MSNIAQPLTMSVQELTDIRDLLMRSQSLIAYLHDQYATELTVDYLPTRESGHEDVTGHKTLEQHEELWEDYYKDERNFHESISSTLLLLKSIIETSECEPQ